MLTNVLIALGLAMDSFTVAISKGAVSQKNKTATAFLIAIYFGGFQSLMTFIGWYAGSFFNKFIVTVAPWIAFLLLVFIGGKMIKEAFQKENDKYLAITHRLLLVLAIATSIDALGVGLSFSFLDKNILMPVIIIGLIAFVFSFFGFYLGKLLSCLFKRKAELIGGLILIFVGFKILLGK